MHYEHRFRDDADNRDREIETTVLEFALLGSQLGLSTVDLSALLRCELSLEELIDYMADQLKGHIQ